MLIHDLTSYKFGKRMRLLININLVKLKVKFPREMNFNLKYTKSLSNVNVTK